MLNDFIKPEGALYIGPAAGKVVPAVRSRLDLFRESGDPVIFICDRHRTGDLEFEIFPPHCLEGDPGGEVIDELSPLPEERIVYKRRYSAFFGTELDLTLREFGVSDLELTGVVTNICVLYTAADARMRNYRVAVNAAAVAGIDEQSHRFALQEMDKTLGVTVL
ncbi:MAG TPA: cysteine hydrolase, partial [Candidatus Moranbacteria bacterium]|nr:cysteine hydrolase [Candidatus Moranbacteria bacterium]